MPSRDELCLVEWKTSKQLKTTLASLYDYPLQVAAYMGAVHADKIYNLKVGTSQPLGLYKRNHVNDICSSAKKIFRNSLIRTYLYFL